MEHVFVGLSNEDPYEKVFLYNQAGTKIRQVLWGDWLTLAEEVDLPDDVKNTSHWLWVRWAWGDAKKRQLLKVKRKYTRSARPMEIIFVDVGIGDGAVLITPERDTGEQAANAGREERIIVIDAGKSKHMREFLDGRFGAYRKGFDFHAAVITHPDADHYYGFSKIFSNAKITFKNVYHNGIGELNSRKDFARVGGTRIGPDGATSYLEKIFVDNSAMRKDFAPSKNRTNWFGKLIAAGIKKKNVGEYRMLGVNLGEADGGRYWVPGFEKSDERPYSIEVLGPWVEYPFGSDDPSLRVFDDDVGKTKNGHSVLLRLKHGNFSVLFGGDLNRSSEMFLLQKYAEIDDWPSTQKDRDVMVQTANGRLGSDVMKSCHHGSSDVTDEFIQAVKPAAFIISSGDQDANYVHPRPDLLGRLGKHGMGDSPVLLSTELQRSTRDIDNRDPVRKLTKQIRELFDCEGQDHEDQEFESKRKEELESLVKKLGKLALPSVAVDGAIYVKTDGKTLITAFKKETEDLKSRWFYYAYHLTGENELELVPMEGGH